MLYKFRLNIRHIPTSLAGLSLGIASLGWIWDSVVGLDRYVQLLSAMLAAVLLILLATKFILHRDILAQDLKDPILGSIVPTFTMTLMVVSVSIGHFLAKVGDLLWLLAVMLHVVSLLIFVVYRLREIKLSSITPSWFVPPVGVVVADVTYGGLPAFEPIAHYVLMFGFIAYSVLLPLVLCRLIFAEKIKDSAKPTIAILAAPASLLLAGYLTIVTNPSPLVVSLLLGIACVMTVVVYMSLYNLIRLPFTASFSSLTFPLVIGATAMFKVCDWLVKIDTPTQYIYWVSWVASLELIIATIVVAYVGAGYIGSLLKSGNLVVHLDAK